jgi:hypothetical protein
LILVYIHTQRLKSPSLTGLRFTPNYGSKVMEWKFIMNYNVPLTLQRFTMKRNNRFEGTYGIMKKLYVI